MKISGFFVNRTFEKSYTRLPKNIKEAFLERKDLFLIDPQHPLLNNHPLHGKWSGHLSINVTGDIRAIYRIVGNLAMFVEIGSHPYLYGK